MRIARLIFVIPFTTLSRFSNETTKSVTFADVTNKISESGNQPRVESAKLSPISRFFCHIRIAIANGSSGFRPFLDSISSIRLNASIKEKLLRNNDANFRISANRLSVFNLNTIFAYKISNFSMRLIFPWSVQQSNPTF